MAARIAGNSRPELVWRCRRSNLVAMTYPSSLSMNILARQRQGIIVTNDIWACIFQSSNNKESRGIKIKHGDTSLTLKLIYRTFLQCSALTSAFIIIIFIFLFLNGIR